MKLVLQGLQFALLGLQAALQLVHLLATGLQLRLHRPIDNLSRVMLTGTLAAYRQTITASAQQTLHFRLCRNVIKFATTKELRSLLSMAKLDA